MRIAVLVKQVPRFEEMTLGPDGRLRRADVELEMNPYCRRAVAKAVELAAERAGSTVTVFTLGPEPAADTLREAIAWGLARGVDIDGVLVTDARFAGSDTLVTAKVLAAALRWDAPFDLVLAGRNSVDADTGQVPPQLAELLDLPFLTGVRHLTIDGRRVRARCEHDDGWLQAEVDLPAVLSCAERLVDPTKVDPAERARVPAERIRTIGAAALGPVPTGEASPTRVGPVRVLEVPRARILWAGDPLSEQVGKAVALLAERGALRRQTQDAPGTVGMPRTGSLCTMVLCEPGREHMTRELLGVAQHLTGNVLAVTVDPPDARALVSWGADEIVHLDGDNVEEDVAAATVSLVATDMPAVILAGSTAWGREVASRVAARLEAGLVGDAVELEMRDERLVAWKPAFGGQVVAAVTCGSPRELATVRAGVLPTLTPRAVPPGKFVYRTVPMRGRNRVRILARTRDDDLDVLAEAHTVIGVGQAVEPGEYPLLEPLRALLGAELGATRKVTDKGWLPRSRQVGITGRAIAPRLFVSIGASGKFNHTVGVRAAGTVLAINPDPAAPIFDACDVGVVGDWHDAVPLLVDALRDHVELAG
jgi:electron transfer flavoprotein alpha subunit